MENNEQKYKEAISKARECMKDGGISQNTIDYLCNIFPELSESEDESMMKVLLRGFKNYAIVYNKFGGVDVSDIIAWLEKQGKKEVDPRYENLEELLAADNIYQIAMNEAMVEEAKSKAINALSELAISKLLDLDKQVGKKIEPNLHVGDNKDNERLIKTSIAFLKLFADEGYENAVECIDWLEKQGNQREQLIDKACDGSVE